MAAQAHSKKEDRAVVISARNFIRAFGGSVGLPIASAIFSNTLKKSISPELPVDVAEHIKAAVFNVPDLSRLSRAQQNDVLDVYLMAVKAVFYLWLAAIAICFFLMVFIKDQGLKRDKGALPAETIQVNVQIDGEKVAREQC